MHDDDDDAADTAAPTDSLLLARASDNLVAGTAATLLHRLLGGSEAVGGVASAVRSAMQGCSDDSDLPRPPSAASS